MTITILDLIQGLPNLVTDFKPESVNAHTHLTIVTDVSKRLPSATDFNINGRVLISASREEVIANWGNKTIDEIADFEKYNFKIMWSDCIICGEDEGAPFKPSLVVRILSSSDNGNVVGFCALRNRYGSSLVTSIFTKPK